MKWQNLIINKCPRCSQLLRQDGGVNRCSNCQFFIGAERREKITKEILTDAMAAMEARAEETKTVVK